MNLFGIVAQATQQTAGNPQAPTGIEALIQSAVPFLVIILVFYFMIIRPQKKQEKKTKAMLDALKVGDKVVTIGGICGKVSKIKDNFVFIETGNIGTQDEKSVLKMERAAIRSVEQK